MAGKSLGKWRVSRRRRSLVAAVVATMLTLIPVIALAHPLGNFTINRYSHIMVAQDQLELDYVMDAAEIPTYQAMPLIDTNRDGTVDEAENATYVSDQFKRLTPLLSLVVDGIPLTLEPTTGTLEVPPGQANLPTLRLTLHYTAALPNGTTHAVEYRNDTFADNLGWREIVVSAAEDVTLANSSAPRESATDALRTYPQDMLQAPLAVDAATFNVDFVAPATNLDGATGATATLPTSTDGSSIFGKATDGFAELITRPLDTPLGLVAALALAFVLGAAHALTPGHGKTIVGAYLVGARGTAKQAVFLGLTTTVTHTAGVFALGFITLFLSQYILPEQLYPWLGAFSGVMVVTIGISMFRQRFRAFTDPSYAADHDHEHADLHEHGDGTTSHNHRHTHIPQNGRLTWRSLLALGVSGGLLPCPSALVLLLSAIALERVGIGLVLIVAFSIGLASVLTGIGFLMVYAARVFNKLPTQGPVFRVVPVLSALFIMGAGALITWQAVAQTGVFPAMSLLAR